MKNPKSLISSKFLRKHLILSEVEGQGTTLKISPKNPDQLSTINHQHLLTPNPEELIPTERVIEITKRLGVSFGRGDPMERIRYFVKLGIVPHAIRKAASQSIVNGQLSTVTSGHFPYWVVKRLIVVDRLNRSGMPFPEIAAKLKNTSDPSTYHQLPARQSPDGSSRLAGGPAASLLSASAALWKGIGISEEEIDKKLKEYQLDLDKKLEKHKQDLRKEINLPPDQNDIKANLKKLTESDLNQLTGYQSYLKTEPGSSSIVIPRSDNLSDRGNLLSEDSFTDDRLPRQSLRSFLAMTLAHLQPTTYKLLTVFLVFFLIFAILQSPSIRQALNKANSEKAHKIASQNLENAQSLGAVLAASSEANKLYIDAVSEFLGETTFIDPITAPNVIYSVTAGTGIAVTAGQNPIVSLDTTELVTTVNSATGTLTLKGSGATSVSTSGSTITISSTDSTGSSGDITAVSAGAGLTGGGSSGDVSLAISLTTSGTTTTTTSVSGLELSSGVTLLRGCSNNNVLSWVTATTSWDCASVSGLGGGDVVGPSSATDNAITRFDSTTGKLVQNSSVIIDDSNNITGIGNLTVTGTTGLTFSGVGGQINFTNGETIDNDTDNQINLGLGTSGTLLLTSTTTASITNSAGALALNAQATGLNLQADGSIDVNIAGGSGSTGCTVANSTGNLTCSGDVTVSGGDLFLTGQASSSSTTEGTMYYDTDDDQLKVYANGKWQSDRTTATKIVGTSHSTNPSQNYEKADYTCASSDCDTTIETAISALPSGGGVVVLLDGTYVIDSDGIDITKSNTSIIGAGKSTILQRGYDTASHDGVITATSVSNITIADLAIDGVKATYTGSHDIGIYFSTTVTYSTIRNTYLHDNDGNGIRLDTNSNNNILKGNDIVSNDSFGILLGFSDSNVITANNISSSGEYGISLGSSSDYNIITSNNIQSTTEGGITLSLAASNNISGNIINEVGASDDGILLASSDNNIISSNRILDTTGSQYGINVSNSSSDNNYFIGNEISGAGFSAETNDLGTGTTIQHRDQFEIESARTSGTLLSLSVPSSTTLAGALIGTGVDLSTNITATGFNVTGQTITLPTVTNVGAGTYAYKGLTVTGNAITQTTLGGTNTFTGLDITNPNITQTTGTITANGLLVTTGSITTGGTQNGLNISASGVGAGSLYGLNIGNITGGAGTERGISIGSGWDSDLAFVDTSPTVTIGDGGTISITDGTNTLCSIADAGTTGNLTCTGNITGSSSGTVGFWSRTSTTLSPATANDIVSIANTNTSGADFAITNTGVYTGTGIFNLTANSATTGTLAAISGTGLTTGNALDITVTNVDATGGTDSTIDINITNNPATNANTLRGLDLAITDADDNANTLYGIYSAVDNSGNTSAGTHTIASGFFDATGKTTGTTTAIGVYIDPITGADNNYGLCFDCDGTWSASTVASGIQFGTDANAVTLYRSASDILRTGDGLTVDLDLIVSGGDITGVGDESIDIGEVISDAITFYINGSAEIILDATQLYPNSAEGNSLGVTTREWEALYLGDDNGSFFGLDQDFSLGYDETTDDRLELTTSGNLPFAVLSNSVTTSTAVGLSATGLTTGEILDITGTWAPSNGSTNEGIDLNFTHSPTGSADNFRSIELNTADGTALANTVYGIHNTLALTGNEAKTGYGQYSTVTSTSTTGDTLYGADFLADHNGALAGATTKTVYGLRSQATNDGITDNASSTVNIYGGYFDATGNTGGTQLVTGLYLADVSGGDTNVALCFDCDGTYTSSTVASGIQFGTDANAVTLYRSASDTLRTGDGLTVDLDLIVSGGDLSLGVNESTNGTLTLYSSGVGITDPTISTNSSGTLLLTGPSGNVTFSLAAGERVIVDGTTANTTTNGVLDINVSSATDSNRGLDIGYTHTATGATTSYGTVNAWASTAVVAGASVSQSGYGIYNTAVKTGADTATGTYNLYGLYSTASNTGRTDAGTVNTYGAYLDATGDTSGTASVFGLYLADVSGGDTNVALCFDCDGTYTSSTVASGIQFGTDANAVTLYRSASDILRTGDGLTVDLDLIVSGNTITFGNGEVIHNDSDATIAFTDGTNTLCSIADAGTTGNLTCTGNITGSSSGTVGFWTRTSTTLSPATANDIVSVANTNTTGADLAITNTGIYTGTGLTAITANSATSGDILTISATALSTGTALTLTGPTSTGVTDHFLKITSDVGSAAALIYGAPDFSGSAVTGYGLNITATDSTANANTDYGIYSSLALTGNAAKTGYGLYGTVTNTSTTAATEYAGYFSLSDTGIVTSGTDNSYGIYSTATRTGSTTAGTYNTYGGYFTTTADSGGAGTTNAYGIYATATGGDNNYAGYFSLANTGQVYLDLTLSAAARSVDAMTITQANDATFNSTGNLLQLTNSDTASTAALFALSQSASGGEVIEISSAISGSNAIGIDIPNQIQNSAIGIRFEGYASGTSAIYFAGSGGTGINFAASSFTGTGISFTDISGGTGISLPASITSGIGISISSTFSGGTELTGDIINITRDRSSITSGTETGNYLDITRANTTTGGTFTISGDLVTISSTCTQTAGTCTDTADILSLTQSYASNTGSVINISDSATHVSGGNTITLASNAVSSGDVISLSGTALTSGSMLVATGPSSTGVTDHFLKITSDVGSAAALIYGAPDFSGSAVTGYGLNITATDATANANTDYGVYSSLALTGNIGKTGVGYYGTVTSSSTTGDTLVVFDAATTVTGIIGGATTRNVYGLRSQPDVGAESTAGTTNVYGVYSKATGDVGAGGTINNYGTYIANGTYDTDGTSAAYGLYIESITGADTNYSAYINGANTAGTDVYLTNSSTTTGSALSITGPTSTGVTSGANSGFVKITSDLGSAGTDGILLYLAPDFSATSATTSNGLKVDATDSTSTANINYANYTGLTLTGNAAKTGNAYYATITSSSTTGDTLVVYDAATTVTGILAGTNRNVYGLRSQPSAGAESTTATTSVYGVYSKVDADVGAGGTVNAYGLYVADGANDTDGTSQAFGIYLEDLAAATLADNNYAICFDCDGTYTTSSAVNGITWGTDANTVTLYRSASDILRTGDGLTVDLDLIVTGNDITFGSGESISLQTDNTIILASDASAGAGVVRLPVKTDTGDPSLNVEGNIYYNTFDNVFRCYQSAAWTNCIGSGGAPAWSAITNPTTTLALTFDAGETNTFTLSEATGTFWTFTGTAFTTGEVFDITTTHAPADGSTNEAIDINITHTPTSSADNFQSINLTTTDGTALGNTVYGISNTLTLTGNAAKSGYDYYGTVTSSSTTADTLAVYDAATSVTGIITTGTRNVYGLRSQPDAGAESTGGTTNVYGLYSKATGDVADGGAINNYGLYVANGTYDTGGVSSTYGIFVEEQTGADFNKAAVFRGQVDIGTTSGTGALLAAGSAYTATITRTTTELTNADLVGRWTAIAIGTDGLPVIAYYNATDGDLNVTKCGNVSCSSGNTTTEISNGDDVGSYASLAIGTDGLPVISHFNDTDNDLNVTKCGNVSCSSGNTTTEITTTDDDGRYTSIAIGPDGFPVISYENAQALNLDLNVTKCGNASCSSGNTTTEISNADNVGQYTSVAIGTDGLPVIAYSNQTDFNLNITKCGNASCSSGNTTTEITNADNTRQYISIAIGADGLPVISHYNASDNEPNVTKCGNTACSSGNTSTEITLTELAGRWTSIAIGTDGLPVIAYYNIDDGDLNVNKCGNLTCSTGNTTTKLTNGDDYGEYASMAIGADGLPVVAEHNATDGDLNVTQCADGACSGATATALAGGIDIGSPNLGFRTLYGLSANFGGDVYIGSPIMRQDNALLGSSVPFSESNLIVTSAATTTNPVSIFAPGLTSGTGIAFTGPSATGITGSAISLTSDVGSAGELIYLAPDFSGSGVTGYGINIAATDSTANTNTDYGINTSLALTGNAAKTGYGIYSTVTNTSTTAATEYAGYFSLSDTGIVTSGTDNSYGIYSTATRTGSTTAGTYNTYGGYFTTTADAGGAGTTNAYGIYATATGGDNNYAAYLNGNVLVGKQTDAGGTAASQTLRSQTTEGTIASGGTANIDGVTSSAVYNGSLYIGTFESGAAQVYRWDGGTTWTVINTTAGRFGTTTAIDGVTAMTVYNGYLYIATEEANSAEVYRYDGGTGTSVFTPVNTTAGRFQTTTSIDGVNSMIVHDGQIYIGTNEANAAEVYRYEGSTGTSVFTALNTTAGNVCGQTSVNSVRSMASYNGNLYAGTEETDLAEVCRYDGGTTLTRVVSAAGTVTSGGRASIDVIRSLAVFNGSLYVGTEEAGAAEIYRYTGSGTDAAATNLVWIQVNATDGTICSQTSVDGSDTMIVYNGILYIGTTETGLTEVCRYDGGTTFTSVVNAAGQIASGELTGIDEITTMTPYNNNGSDILFIGTTNDSGCGSGCGEVYSFTGIEGQSFALLFNAVSDNGGGEQNSFLNLGSISFAAEQPRTGDTGNSATGSFLLSHAITTVAGGYDVAEDYPTRDESLEPGNLVSVDTNQKGFVKKAQGAYDNQVLGIYSENPGLRLSQKDGLIDGAKAVPIALAGRVPVKVSTENGLIKAGDSITSSSIPGVGMRATQPGRVIGIALESFDTSSVILACPESDNDNPNLVCANATNRVCEQSIPNDPVSSEPETGSAQANSTNYELSTQNCTGKVLVYVNPTFYMGSATALDEWSTLMAKSLVQSEQLNQEAADLHALLAADITKAEELLAKLENKHIPTEEEITSLVKDEVNSQLISLGYVNYEAAGSTEASGSSVLAAQTNKTLSDLEKLLATTDLSLSTLTLTGIAQLAQTQIAGTLSQDGTLIIDYGRQINVLGSTLYLQNDALAGCPTDFETGSDSDPVSCNSGILVDIGRGRLTVDRQGNLIAQGEIEAQGLVLSESATAPTVGSSLIPAGASSVIIETSAIKPGAKVLITATGPTGGKSIYLSKKTDYESFTAAIENGPAAQNIEFDWLIINTLQVSSN